MQSIIKSSQVHVEPPVPAPAHVSAADPRARASGRAQHGAPEVELLRLEDRVHALRLTCACGQVTVVELDYAPAPANPSSKTPPA